MKNTVKKLVIVVLLLALLMTLAGCRWEIAPGLALKIELETSKPFSTSEPTDMAEMPQALIDPTVGRDPNEAEQDVIP